MKWYASAVTFALLIALAFIWTDPGNSERPDARANPASLEKQRECSQQAEKMFQSLGWGKPQRDVIADYVSHYNVKLNRCFLEISIIDYSNAAETGGPMETLSVADAFERRGYGDFLSWSIKGQSVPHIAQCDSDPLRNSKKVCNSQDEWKRLMRPYMEDGLM